MPHIDTHTYTQPGRQTAVTEQLLCSVSFSRPLLKLLFFVFLLMYKLHSNNKLINYNNSYALQHVVNNSCWKFSFGSSTLKIKPNFGLVFVL